MITDSLVPALISNHLPASTSNTDLDLPREPHRRIRAFQPWEEDRRRHVPNSRFTPAAFSFSPAAHLSLHGAGARRPRICGGGGSSFRPGLSTGTLDRAGTLLARRRGHSLWKVPRAGSPSRHSATWQFVEYGDERWVNRQMCILMFIE